mgnify:CR=1 FL=1
MKFEDIIDNDKIFLYCGWLPRDRRDYTNIPFVGLSLYEENETHIQHDITRPMPLKDNTVDIVQSEDVMEHIEYSMLKKSIDEIFRVLKPGGLFRLSMPDYKCDVLYNRSEKDGNGNIIFDNGGGGRYDRTNEKVVGGGHVWFPVFSSVKSLLESTHFSNDKINYLHYYDENDKPIMNKIDYSKGYIRRTPDHDDRVKNPSRPMSIVVDLYK